MNAGASLKDTKKLIDDLKAMLIKDAGILDGGAADKEDGSPKPELVQPLLPAQAFPRAYP